MHRSNSLARLSRLVLGLVCLTLAVPLAAYSYNGLSMRLSGDDFCYSGVVRLHGFFESQWYTYLNVSMYNGNRYSLTLFSSLAGIFPPAVNGLLPALAILLFLGGIFWVISTTARLIAPLPDKRPDYLVLLLSSEAIVFFTLYLAPNLGQSLYWRSGMLTYLAPLIANTFLIGVILSQSQRDYPIWASVLACLCLSILAGGFSETGIALQGAYLGLALIGTVLMSWRKNGHSGRAVWLTTASLAGTLIALLLLLISPTNPARMAQMPPTPGILETISISLNAALVFAYISIKSQIVPNALLALLFLMLGLLSSRYFSAEMLFSWRRWFFAGLILVPGGSFLLVSIMVPFAYVQHSYPELRALIISHFVIVICEAAAGWLVGLTFIPLTELVSKPSAVNLRKPALPEIFVILAAVVFMLAFSIYPLYAARGELSQNWHYQKWARFWDARDLAIIQARKQGTSNVKVVKIDHIIQNVADLSPDSKFWYNGCAAIYYDVTAIKASLPGWDNGE